MSVNKFTSFLANTNRRISCVEISKSKNQKNSVGCLKKRRNNYALCIAKWQFCCLFSLLGDNRYSAF